MTAVDVINTAITDLQQEIATQEASNPLYAQRDSLSAQLASVVQQIITLEAANPDITFARASLARLQRIQSTPAVSASPIGG